MSDNRRVTGERVFCHQCNHEWDRAHGGLTCPRCEGEFTEILEPGTTTTAAAGEESPVRQPSEPRSVQYSSPFARQPAQPSPFHDHNPWRDAPDPEESDISTYEFNTRGGRGTISWTTSYSSRSSPAPRQQSIFGGSPFGFANNNPPAGNGFSREFQTNGGFTREFHGQVGPGNMQDIFSLIFQTMQHGGFAQPQRQANNANQPPNPFELLGALLNPGNARAGDHVWSQEAFDRILEQLAEQNTGSTAPGPASEAAIAALPSKKVDAEMLGDDGKGECSICMDSVQLGTEVTVLPCTHWFHKACVSAWLKEHDTCPHCRSPITRPEEGNNTNNSSRPGERRRRSSRRSSSVASPFGAANNPIVVPDSPSGLREARQQYYYSHRRESETDRTRNNRPGSTHSDQNTSSRGNNSGGGISGTVSQWFRDRMNPGGS